MTYSICARCPITGRLGVAVQSHYFSVGSVVTWVEAGVGAVATQSMAEVAHGPNGLARLGAGETPSDALAALIAADPGGALRQVGIVDAHGGAAAHTGERCIAEAGHVVGDGFTTQANMMADPGVPEAMADAFATSRGDLWIRLLGALDAAEALGGDIRGRQSAALLVSTPEPADRPGAGHELEVRVDDHADPLGELRRLATLGMAYRSIDRAEHHLALGEIDAAAAIYDEVLETHPHHVEFVFWAGVAFAAAGDVDRGRSLMDSALAGENGDRWRELLRRLPATELYDASVVDELLR